LPLNRDRKLLQTSVVALGTCISALKAQILLWNSI
jgi:hypothetical protein